jgi:hypothetical protein
MDCNDAVEKHQCDEDQDKQRDVFENHTSSLEFRDSSICYTWTLTGLGGIQVLPAKVSATLADNAI